MAHDHHDESDEFHVHPHISSTRSNLTVLGALLLLTGLTLAAYRIRLGEYNLLVAIVIASMKAILVGTFFMHLKYEKAYNTLFFTGTVIFIAIFFGYTYNDTGHRAEVDPRSGAREDYRTGSWANGTAPGLVEHGELQPLVGAEGEVHAPAVAPANRPSETVAHPSAENPGEAPPANVAPEGAPNPAPAPSADVPPPAAEGQSNPPVVNPPPAQGGAPAEGTQGTPAPAQ